MAADYGGLVREFFSQRWTSQLDLASPNGDDDLSKIDPIKPCSTEEDLETLQQTCGDWIAGCGATISHTANLQDLPQSLTTSCGAFHFSSVR
ncbi:unnamed protein product [Boreogadus saida]